MDHSINLKFLEPLFAGLPELLTAAQIEERTQIDRKTIYGYVQRGLIPYVRIESNVRFSKHQVLQWLEERTFQPRPVNGKGARRQ
jgi:excisionase family DNA binding protein